MAKKRLILVFILVAVIGLSSTIFKRAKIEFDGINKIEVSQNDKTYTLEDKGKIASVLEKLNNYKLSKELKVTELSGKNPTVKLHQDDQLKYTLVFTPYLISINDKYYKWDISQYEEIRELIQE